MEESDKIYVDDKIQKICFQLLNGDPDFNFQQSLVDEYLDELNDEDQKKYFLSEFPGDGYFEFWSQLGLRTISHLENFRKLTKYVSRLKKKYRISKDTSNIASLNYKQIVGLLHSENIITKFQKTSFTLLLSKNKIDPKIEWHDSDWKLYLLIEFLKFKNIIELLPDQSIKRFCNQYFTLKNGKTLRYIKQNYDRAERSYRDERSYIFGDYSLKLTSIFNK